MTTARISGYIHTQRSAGLQTWNDIPEDVTSAESMETFRRHLNTYLFRKSFPDYLLHINSGGPSSSAAT